jgi:hypothetical protein
MPIEGAKKKKRVRKASHVYVQEVHGGSKSSTENHTHYKKEKRVIL